MKLPLNQIGFDFDGVIADTADAFIQIACKQYGFCSFTRDDITNFDLEDCINVPLDVVEKIFTEIMLDSVGTGLQPITGAIETINLFTTVAPVTVITARPYHKPVYDWLDQFFSGPEINRIKVVTTGDHNDKVRHIRDCGLQYFIDDRAETCLQLARENISAYVFSQPWNRNKHDLPTIEDWATVKAMVKDLPDE